MFLQAGFSFALCALAFVSVLWLSSLKNLLSFFFARTDDGLICAPLEGFGELVLDCFIFLLCWLWLTKTNLKPCNFVMGYWVVFLAVLASFLSNVRQDYRL